MSQLKYLGILAIATLVTAASSGSSAVSAENNTTATAPVVATAEPLAATAPVAVTAEPSVVESPAVATAEPSVATAPVEQPITVYVGHAEYGVGLIGSVRYMINPGETITAPADNFPGLRPNVSQFVITYEQAKVQIFYEFVYYAVEPPVVTTVEPSVVTTTTEPATTTTSNGGGQTTTQDPKTKEQQKEVLPKTGQKSNFGLVLAGLFSLTLVFFIGLKPSKKRN